ncbi:hypothetical protein YS40_134 [Thermus phage phiYS40]|uniref:hypothetical protein n=1 Tax=Thermus phage phiYS40 TaxID=407392 RepID=UPI0000E689FC|nr:hypothetical protein YS40_134 [Thermus phage phiYS40]ABJ91528.1 hypothetical protein YS40_134 [Thermus phage phiYS40]BAK53652.1 hypothetical protein YSP_134 [Thermus phage phiYS40]
MKELIKINKQTFFLNQIEINYEYFNEKNLEEFKFHYLAEISAKNKNSLERLIEKVLSKAIIKKDFDLTISKSINVYSLGKNKECKLDLEMSKQIQFARLVMPNEKRIKNAFYFFIEDSIEELIEFFSLRKGIPLTRFDLVVSLSSHERSRHKTPYSSVFKLKYKVLDLGQHLFNLPDLYNSVPTPHPSV